VNDDDDLAPLRRRAPPPPPTDFVDGVMRQLATRPLPRMSRWRALFAERELRLRFRPATALAAAVALALVGLLVARPRSTAVVTVPASASAARSDAPALVRFAVAAPAARAVSLAGDFNGWRPDATPLERGPDGVWQVRVPLGRGNWSYSFVIDGRWVEDPLADTWRADGFGGRNAIVRVGELPATTMENGQGG
jgi:hypothetical protein